MGNCYCKREKVQQAKDEENTDIWKEKQKAVQNIINELYNQSWRLRPVDEQYKPFIQEVQDMQELKRNYSLNLQAMKDIKQHINQFIPVRGDGNCFYTAFGYQFLEILLSDDQKFKELIKEVKNIELPMKIFLEQNIEIYHENQYELLRNDFIYRLQQINKEKSFDEKIRKLRTELAAYQQNENTKTDGCFYGLLVIFLRNYLNYIIQNNQWKELLFDIENLLIWEKECNNNEIVLIALSEHFKLHVKLFFFQNTDFNLHEYGQGKQNKIYLLMHRGHYNIGLQRN